MRAGTNEKVATPEDARVGDAIRRREDPALVTGETQYTYDNLDPRALHLAVLRSQHAHARLESIDTSAAEGEDGVHAVFTADDLKDTPVWTTITEKRDPPDEPPAQLNEGVNRPMRPPLADERVRYTGEPVAVVIAQDRYVAETAADLIDVEYDTLDALVDPTTARDEETPTLHDNVPDNVAFDWEIGDADAVDQAFVDADNTVSLDLKNQRLAPSSMEPRSVLADYRPDSGELTVTVTTQTPHRYRSLLANILDLPEHKVQVVAPNIGGGFGLKAKSYPAELLAAWCSLQLGRPIKWQGTRSEAFRADIQGRGHDTTAELAFDDDGTFRALRARTTVDLGAYLSGVAAFIATDAYAQVLPNQYDFEVIHCRTIGVYTNKTLVDAYRGAGRPQAAYVTERLVHQAARELGVDPTELRRQNFISSRAFPYQTPTGIEYDSGDYNKTMEQALELIDYEDIRERQQQLREEGRYLGVGFGCFTEIAGDAGSESNVVQLTSSGTVRAHLGSSSQGQGHKTTMAQVIASNLGIHHEDIEVNEGDTDKAPNGTGTYGSRTAMTAGTSLVESCRKIREQARELAAHRLEAAPTDVEFDDGEFHVRGAPERSIHLKELAQIANTDKDLPEGVEAGLEVHTIKETKTTTPFGTHAAVVEIDPRTGDVKFKQFVAVDDCGHQINPTVVEGQIHGGLAQGIGQALHEEVIYEDNGTLITDSYQNYTMPRANNLPEFKTAHTETPSPHNPLGVKGVGESGTIGSTVAVVNAVVDALEPFGIDHLDMPATPETVWQAIQDKRE